MNTMMEAIKGIMVRLSLIEGQGSDQAQVAGGPSVPRAQRSGPPPRADATQSTNMDFASVCKYIYRLAQLDHHAANWTQLPAALKKRLERFAGDIKPPMTDEDFRRQINDATEKYSREVCRITREHLEKKRAEKELEASRLNPMDLDKARPIAEKYLQSRLGSRLDQEQRQSFIERAMAKIGTMTTARPMTDNLPQQPADLEEERSERAAQQDPVVKVGEIRLVASKKRDRPDSTPSPVQTRNKFQPLNSDDSEDHILLVSPFDSDAEGGAMGGEEAERVEMVPHAQASKPSIPLSPVVRIQRLDGLSQDSRPRRMARGVILHEGPKEGWDVSVTSGTKVLVIGDSNCRDADATRLPTGWDVHAFPGAKFRHVSQILRRLEERTRDAEAETMLDHIIVQVGINHRDDPLDSFRDEIANIERKFAHLAKRMWFVGISVANSLDSSTRRNVDRINHYLSGGNFGYFPPLPSAEVSLRARDVYGIHFDEGTIARIFDGLVRKVNEPALN